MYSLRRSPANFFAASAVILSAFSTPLFAQTSVSPESFFPSLPGDQRVIDEQVWEPFTRAILQRDIDMFFSVHSKEVIRAEGRARRVSRFNDYRSSMEKAWNRPGTSEDEFELRFNLRLSEGTTAFETGIYRGRSRRANGEVATFYGSFAVALRKEEGRWKILVDADGFDPRTVDEESFQAAHPLTTVARKGPYFGQRPPGTRAEIFAPGLISASGRKEGCASFSPDGKTFYFSLITPDGRFATHVSQETGHGWSEPVLAEFARQGNTGDAFVSPNGERLYFASSRPPGTPPWNHRIWAAIRTPQGWGSPELVPLEINTEKGVHFPTIDQNGLLFVGSHAEKTTLPNLGKSDIYFLDTAAPSMETKHLPSPVNSAHEEWDPYIAPDSSYLLFESDRPGGAGSIDIWVSFRNSDGTWGDPINLGPDVNTSGVDVQARVTHDGKYLFFERPQAREQDIWWASAEVITKLRPAKNESGAK